MSVRVIAGRAKGRPLRVPRGSSTRPTSSLVRSALFSILAPYLPDAHVLDLFAGTGALGIEALSRGVAHADFVESQPRQHAALKANLHSLGFSEVGHARLGRVEQVIPTLTGPYQVVFLDPPYSHGRLRELLERIGASRMVQPDTVVVVEHSSRQPPPDVCGALSLDQRRTYGETAISLYGFGGREW